MERMNLRTQFEETLGDWVEDLRFACQVLRRNGPDTVAAISVCDRLRSEADRSLFLAVIGRLQDEFHVDASVQLNGCSFSVRFLRAGDASSDTTADARQNFSRFQVSEPARSESVRTGTPMSPTGERKGVNV